MLGYLILAAAQFAAAFYGTPAFIAFAGISVGGNVQNFIAAAVAAVIVWITGAVGSLILKDVKMPVSATLAGALAGAVIGALIVTVPQIKPYNPITAPAPFFWIAGAILGYLVKR